MEGWSMGKPKVKPTDTTPELCTFSRNNMNKPQCLYPKQLNNDNT